MDAVPRAGIVQNKLKNLISSFVQEEKAFQEELLDLN
jgi:hypothetical protein